MTKTPKNLNAIVLSNHYRIIIFRFEINKKQNKEIKALRLALHIFVNEMNWLKTVAGKQVKIINNDNNNAGE